MGMVGTYQIFVDPAMGNGPECSMSTRPHDIRVAQYPDGSKRVQGAYQWVEGHRTGTVWRDIPVVNVDTQGREVIDE